MPPLNNLMTLTWFFISLISPKIPAITFQIFFSCDGAAKLVVSSWLLVFFQKYLGVLRFNMPECVIVY